MARVLRHRVLLMLLGAFLLGAGAVAIFVSLPERTPPAAKDSYDPENQHPLAGRFTADDTTVEDCDGDAHGFRTVLACREQAVGNVAFREGPNAAFDVIDAKVAGPDGASWRGDAHLIQHIVGSAALARFKGATGRAFAEGNRSNATAGSGGYYHGIILRAMQGARGDELGKRADKLCSDPAVRANGFLTYQCLHGMGHGLMIFTGADLPRALEACDQIAAAKDQFSCHTGAFMENVSVFMGVDSGVRSRYIRDDDPLYPCNWVAQRHKQPCYIQATIRMGPAVNWDWRRIGATCAAAEPAFVNACYYSTGGWAWALSQGATTPTLERCRMLGPGTNQCINAVAGWIVGNSDTTGRESAAFCRAARRSEQPHCFAGIGQVIGQWGTRHHHATCRRLAGAYATACMNPGRL